MFYPILTQPEHLEDFSSLMVEQIQQFFEYCYLKFKLTSLFDEIQMIIHQCIMKQNLSDTGGPIHSSFLVQSYCIFTNVIMSVRLKRLVSFVQIPHYMTVYSVNILSFSLSARLQNACMYL